MIPLREIARIDLASSKLAFFLIAILFLHILLSAIIPQAGIASDEIISWKEILGDRYEIIEKLRLDRIYDAPPFFILLGLLSLNLFFGNLRRFRLIYKVEKTLLKLRHIGSMVFHLALLWILISAQLNYIYKFEGVFGLTEGQKVEDTLKDYYQVKVGSARKVEYRRFSMKFNKLQEDFQVGNAQTDAMHLRFTDLKTTEEEDIVIRVNKPFQWQGLEFHQGPRTGWSPRLSISDAEGGELFNSFVRLSTQSIGGQQIYSDFVQLTDDATVIHLEVDPGESAHSLPVTHVTVERYDEHVYNGKLVPGQHAQAGNLQLSIPELRRWAYVEVVENPWLPQVFLGFWLALAGLTLTFVARVSREGKRK